MYHYIICDILSSLDILNYVHVHVHLILLVMPPPATHDVTFNIITTKYTPATSMMATTTATTEDVTKFDGRRENQQSCE